MDDKQKFIDLLTATKRPGIDKVIAGLDKLGFFNAPASTMFHLNEVGGLLKHSLNVFEQAMAIRESQIKLFPALAEALPVESIIIASLLHDVCKAEIYKTEEKFRKDKDGKWEKYLAYKPDYSGMPLGHGEKSVIRLLRMGLEMTNDEILAIRWHMANWSMSDDKETLGNFGAATDKCPLLSVIICADELAARISENTNLVLSKKEEDKKSAEGIA